MKHIVKQHPPKELFEYLKTPNATWEGCPCKSEWKKSLLQEQGYICAYTMKQISEENMKIEHFLPRDKYPKLALKYKNTLAVCDGNEGAPIKDQYADTRKGNRELTCIDPRHRNCERKVFYLASGEIDIDDPELRDELLDDHGRDPIHYSVLNLNHDTLVDGRHSTYKVVKKKLGKNEKEWRLRDLKDMIEKYERRNAEGQYEEYCMFILYRLRLRLKRFKK